MHVIHSLGNLIPFAFVAVTDEDTGQTHSKAKICKDGTSKEQSIIGFEKYYVEVAIGDMK